MQQPLEHSENQHDLVYVVVEREPNLRRVAQFVFGVLQGAKLEIGTSDAPATAPAPRQHNVSDRSLVKDALDEHL